TPSALSCTSNSVPSAPSRRLSSKAARVFSTVFVRAPRWPKMSGRDGPLWRGPQSASRAASVTTTQLTGYRAGDMAGAVALAVRQRDAAEHAVATAALAGAYNATVTVERVAAPRIVPHR